MSVAAVVRLASAPSFSERTNTVRADRTHGSKAEVADVANVSR